MTRHSTCFSYCLAGFLGAASNLSFAPYNHTAVIFIALSVMFFILKNKNIKQRFLLSWTFGFFHFAFGTYWIINALMKDDTIPLLVMPLALGGLSLLLGLYPALAFLGSSFFKNNAAKAFAFSGLWTLLEWVRSWLFTGFPWNPLGSIFAAKDETIQAASIFGVYGLSLITAFTAAISVYLYDLDIKSKIEKSMRYPLIKYLAAVFTPFCLLFFILYGYGYVRLKCNPTTYFENTNIRIIQPSIDQKLKWDRASIENNFLSHLELNLESGAEKNNAFIWGETASPYDLNQDEYNRYRAIQTLPINSLLITGIIRDDGSNYYNSMTVISKEGKVIDYYDKTHRVPFGEYVPFRSFRPIGKITEGYVDLGKGAGAKIITTDILPPFTPIICYEVIFSGEIKPKGLQPSWFLNITNDGWYGQSSGPYQHLAAAKMRAVEEGIPLVRVANTGISCIIDALGRVLKQIPLNTKDFADSSLPQPVKQTAFNLFGNKIPLFMAFFMLVIATVFLIKPKVKK
ncbi:MAG: apolipoprotein N-acyltransferase [Alphaproteobacteria bacterium]